MAAIGKTLGMLLSATLLLACGSAPPPQPSSAKKKIEQPQVAPVPAGHLERASLEYVLKQGPPWLFERVPIEEVVRKGKFVGWRIQGLPHLWDGVGLAPGDVVTSVNGMPLATPNDFWAAWTTLTVASEIKIAYRREGEKLEASIPISGSPSAEIAESLKRSAPAADASAGPGRREKRKATVVIEGENRPLSDTTVDWTE